METNSAEENNQLFGDNREQPKEQRDPEQEGGVGSGPPGTREPRAFSTHTRRRW
jgi:hypothetical protein